MQLFNRVGTTSEDKSYLSRLMERKCELCGEIITGRSDKRFCSDSCRSEFHNASRKKADPMTGYVNRSLLKNLKLLDTCFIEGATRTKVRDLKKMGFDFEYFTSMEKNLPWRREYCCYKYKYHITLGGIVHISECAESK